ncbi:MAG: four helix bundle protein [Chloroflexaceae bacterium]
MGGSIAPGIWHIRKPLLLNERQRLIARHNRISLPRGCSADERLARLRAALIHQRTVRVTSFSLDAATQAALQDLRHARTGIRTDDLVRRYGPIRPLTALAGRRRTTDGGRQSAVSSRQSVREPRSVMGYKFERLEVWQLALDYTDIIYALADRLPAREAFNLKRQMIRAVTSIALNIAEGSTGQSNAEQARFLGIAVRSLLETVACLHLIHRRGYLTDPAPLRDAYRSSETLFAKLQAFRKQITPKPATQVREDPAAYPDDTGLPF